MTHWQNFYHDATAEELDQWLHHYHWFCGVLSGGKARVIDHMPPFSYFRN